MKKFLTILGAVGLTATASSSVVACGSSDKEQKAIEVMSGEMFQSEIKASVNEGLSITDAAKLFEVLAGKDITSPVLETYSIIIKPGDSSKLGKSDSKNTEIRLEVSFKVPDFNKNGENDYVYTLVKKDGVKLTKIQSLAFKVLEGTQKETTPAKSEEPAA